MFQRKTVTESINSARLCVLVDRCDVRCKVS